MTKKRLFVIDGGSGVLINSFLLNYKVDNGIILTRDLDQHNKIYKPNLCITGYNSFHSVFEHKINANIYEEVIYIHSTCSSFVPSSLLRVDSSEFIKLISSDLMILHNVLIEILKFKNNF